MSFRQGMNELWNSLVTLPLEVRNSYFFCTGSFLDSFLHILSSFLQFEWRGNECRGAKREKRTASKRINFLHFENQNRVRFVFHYCLHFVVWYWDPCPSEYWRYARAFTNGIQEFVGRFFLPACVVLFPESQLFAHYVFTNRLMSQTQLSESIPLKVSAEDYLLGLADFTGELMRLCVTSAGRKQLHKPLDIVHFIKTIHSCTRHSYFPGYDLWKG